MKLIHQEEQLVMRLLLSSLISLLLFATSAQAWEYTLDDFSTSSWGGSSGWGSCNAYSSFRPCISNGSYFSVDSGDVVFSYGSANIYDVIDVSDMSYSYDSGKTYYISFDAMVGPRNSEQRNKTEALGITIYYKKSDGSTIGSESFSQSINNTSMETFEFALSDTFLSQSDLDNIQIVISGRDNGFWNGNYGMVVANGSVQLTDYDPTAPPPQYESSISSAQTQDITDSRSVTHSGNGIYIQQSGDNLDLDVQQHGDDNLVAGTSTTSQTISDAVVSGDYNTVNITQGSVTNSSDDNVLLFGINGNHNSMTVSQGDASGDTGGHRAIIDITGGYNSIGLTQYNLGFGTGQFADINVNGNDNTVSSAQRETDKILFVDINGSDNSLTTNQKDSGQHFLDITLGSDQTVSVTQEGTGDHAATIDLSGYSSTLQLNQNSSTDQNYVINQNCLNANGCGTTTVNQY